MAVGDVLQIANGAGGSIVQAWGPQAGGPTGPTGPAGANGTNGTNGTDGLTVRSGSGAPSAGLGVNGDWYIDTIAHAIYGPKAGGAWGSPTSLVGPTGATGASGQSTTFAQFLALGTI
jgi:integrin beta 8